MSESFYKLYKATRDMVEEFRGIELDEDLRQFIDDSESGCNDFDKVRNDLYLRWKKEREDENKSKI